MLATINLTLRGTPYIYEGQEIGMTNGDFASMSQFMDVETHRIDAIAKKLHFPRWLRWKMIKKTSRDNARTPMQWNQEGGFTNGTPWLKINSNQSTINVENNLKNKDSIYHYYHQLIQLRKNNNVLINGSFKPIHMKRNIFIFERSFENKTYIVVANMSSKKMRINLLFRGKILLSNTNRNVSIDPVILPYEAMIIEKEGNK
jgi:oligo-1,6-glucosidase